MNPKNLSIISIAIGIVLFIGSAHSQALSGRPGAFADIGLGLRPLGMGGAYTALASDENAARWNPALLARTRDRWAGFTWTRQFSLITYNYLSASIPLRDGAGIGAYAITSGDAVYRETTIGLAMGTGVSRVKLPVKNLDLGATVKIYLTDFGNDESGGEYRVTGSSFGFGLDVAAYYSAADRFSFALVARDVVNQINWNSSVKGDYSEGLPRTLTLSGAYTLDKAVLAVDFQPGLYGDTRDRISLGAEFKLWGILRPRFGLSQNLTAGGLNRWMTVGLGMNFSPQFLGPVNFVSFGYTHLFHEIDHSPRVGLALRW